MKYFRDHRVSGVGCSLAQLQRFMLAVLLKGA